MRSRPSRLLLVGALAIGAQVPSTARPAAQTPPVQTAPAPAQGDAAAIDRLLAQGPDLIKNGRYDDLGANAEEAVRLSRQINDNVRLMRSLNSLMSAHFYRSRYEDAIGIGREVVRLSLLQPNRTSQAFAFNNLGAALREAGDFEEALDWLTRARDLSNELGDRLSAANTTRNIGVLYGELGDSARSEAIIRDALAAARDLKNPVYEEVFLASLAPTEIAQGRLQDAMQDYQRVLTLDEQNKLTGGRVEVLGHMAVLEDKLNQHEKSIQTATEALALARASSYTQAEAAMLAIIGKEHRLLGQLDDALQYLTQANDLFHKTATPIFWESGLELARTLRALGRPADAVTPARETLAEIERVRLRAAPVDASTGSVIAVSHEAFTETIDLFASLGRSADAFDVAEQYRARAFLDLLAEARAGVRRSLTPEERTHEESLVRRLDAADHALEQPGLPAQRRHDLEQAKAAVDDEFETFRADLRRVHPSYAGAQYPDLLGVQRVQREVLDSGSALVEYALGDDRSYVWAITKTDSRMAVLPKRQEIESRVSAFRTALTAAPVGPGAGRSSADLDRLSDELYQQLVAPVAGALSAARTLVIVPDGTLAYLPFEALRARETPGAKPAYLVAKYLISYAPSASALHAIDAVAAVRSAPGQSLLAFGDPDFGDPLAANGRHLARLPYTRAEVTAIGGLFAPASRAIYLGRAATETVVAHAPLDTYRYVHFATHGLIDESQPGRSSIALSIDPASKDDGLLPVRDIMDLRLNADLVTLSACGTGLGLLVNGEGVVGLTRAFLYAGARSVVVSLWNVNDAATAELMKAFYSNLERGQPKDVALREAKRAFLASPHAAWRNPYYWAPFVLIGQR